MALTEILKLPATARTDQWWRPKASSLLNVLYLVMYLSVMPFAGSMFLFVPAILTITGTGSFGHFINDWFDIEADARAGKNNRFARFSFRQKGLLVCVALLLGLLPWMVLPFDRVSIILLGVEFLLLLGYALPPVRIKERIYLAILTDATYAYALPAVLAAHTFFLAAGTAGDRVFIATLFLWQLFLGMRHFLNHLAMDRVNDQASRTRTLATVRGNRYLHRLISRLILPLELLSFGGFLMNLSRYGLWLVLSWIFFFVMFNSLLLSLAAARRNSPFPYRFSDTPLDGFYQNTMPLIPLLFLIYRDPRYLLILGAHFALFNEIRFGPVYLPLAATMRSIASRFFGGLAGYPARKLIRASNGMRNRSGHLNLEPNEPACELSAAQGGKLRSRRNVAIVNLNKSKYTETFITEIIPRLNYNVYYLYGGELPIYDDEGRHYLSGRGTLHALALFFESLFRVNQGYFIEHSLASYLQAKNILALLAEFGPTGARILPVTRDLGIPLIVYFHGYDVFHQPTWNVHFPSYQKLFREADRIIVVSSFMRERLHQSGAPLEKLIHLPAFVNLDLFPYRDRSAFPPRFISVGRFAETKSPHLTILAFKRVVDAIPGATLVMAGKGGGGELFEACLILSKALGLDDKITFKGVLSHQEVAEEMSQARVFVQHSVTTPENQDMEGKPVAIMEAMAGGLAVIATRHSGIAELITNEVDGLLVDEFDIEAMVAAMIRAVKYDSLAGALGKAASERIRNDPLIRDHIRILEGIIDECITSWP
jgi:glycosyltransferase involved in cell wall biosynthesis